MPVCILLGDYRDIAHERKGLVNVLAADFDAPARIGYLPIMCYEVKTNIVEINNSFWGKSASAHFINCCTDQFNVNILKYD